MKKLLLAFQFLTIIPLKVKGDISEEEMFQSAAFFPVVGVFQGLLAILSAALLIKVFPVEITGGLIILILIISNGGFHLDGLADTFDALAFKSNGNEATYKEKRLSVMKDSSTGAIGAVSVVISILLKFLFINSILCTSTPFTAYGLLFLMPVFSKWAMVISMFYGKPAREDGLGRIFIDRIGFKEITISTLILLILLPLPQMFFRIYTPNSQYVFYVALFVTTYFFCRLSVNFFNKKFGGLTGDTLGAMSEISEILFLMAASAWSRLSI